MCALRHPSCPEPGQKTYISLFSTITVLLICCGGALIAYPAISAGRAYASAAGVHATGTADDWTMYRHDLGGSGASLDTTLTPGNVGQLHQVWSYQTGGGISTGVMVVSGVAYVGSWD